MPYIDRLSKEFIDILTDAKEYHLNAGQIIQSTEDRKVFNMVKSGYIKRYLIGTDGQLGVQVLYGPNDIFPITLAFHALLGMEISESKEVYYYEAMTDAVLYSLQAEQLCEEVQKNPLLYKDLMAIAGRRLHSTLNGLENLTVKTSYERVAHQLAYLANRFGEKKGKGAKITLPITIKDLSEILNLSRDTVSSAMNRLRDNGLIKTGDQISIPNVDKLLDEAFGS